MTYMETRGPAWTAEICGTCARHNKEYCPERDGRIAGSTAACEKWEEGDDA